MCACTTGSKHPGALKEGRGRGTGLGVGLDSGALDLGSRGPPSLQGEEMVSEACPYFLMYRALLPRPPPPPPPPHQLGWGHSGSDLPSSGARAGLGVSASALIISVCVGEGTPVAISDSELLRLLQLESPCSPVLAEAGEEVSKSLGAKSVLSLVLCAAMPLGGNSSFSRSEPAHRGAKKRVWSSRLGRANL